MHSSREHFHTYLQSLDVERHGLHEQFRDRLAAVLARYGVTELDRTPELEEAVFRIFLAQRRTTADVHLVSSLLQRWITEPAPAESLTWPVREVLDRLVRATQLRFPVVGDLARSVRFRWFDQPLVDEDRSSVLAGVSGELSALSDDAATDRAERIDALAAIPEQIVRFLAERLEQRRARARADARGAGPAALPRVRPARPAGPRRRPAVRGRRLRPRRDPADPPRLHARHDRRARRPDRRPGHRHRRAGGRPPGRRTRPSSTSTSRGPASSGLPRRRGTS